MKHTDKSKITLNVLLIRENNLMNEWIEYENKFEECEYVNQSYYEYDTGYAEYECLLIGDGCQCFGGCIDSGCPLAFKYKVE